jgi:hypothetical protein
MSSGQNAIDVEAVASPLVEDIVLVATVAGLEAGRITIPVSTDLRDSVLSVARRSVDVDIRLKGDDNAALTSSPAQTDGCQPAGP